LVFGGKGDSFGPKPPDNYYTNDRWFDDVSDGPVKAEIVFQDGARVEAEPAWVIVAPPDFAPTITGIVTLYDVLCQVSYDDFGQQMPNRPSFTQDIYPLLKRTMSLQWVNDDPHWTAKDVDFDNLADPSIDKEELRKGVAEWIISTETGAKDVLGAFYFREFQKHFLEQWGKGIFDPDWHGEPGIAATITPEGLTRAALEACAGQGFLPGIEAGILMENSVLYSQPFDFRINHNAVTAGDLTARMAQPWQADFLACEVGWWPAQRPDIIRRNSGDSSPKLWARPWARPWEKVPPDEEWKYDYKAMVDHALELGVVMPKFNAQGQLEGYFEDGRSVPEPLTGSVAAAFVATTAQRKLKFARRKRTS